MRSFRKSISDRRKAFLSFAGQIEGQLRAAYDRRHEEGSENQVTLADKLGITRSAVNKRLTGRINMTMETIADLAWALGYEISVHVFDPKEMKKNSNYLNYEPTLTATASTSARPTSGQNGPRQAQIAAVIQTAASNTVLTPVMP